MEAVPALIGAGSSLIGGVMGSNAASNAAKLQADAARRGQDLQYAMYQQGREDLRPQREFNTGALAQLAARMGMTGQPSEDYYLQPGRPNYLSMIQPYIEGLQPLANMSADTMNRFLAPPGVSGLPTWMEDIQEGFKTSPGYQFARDEARRMGMQATPGAGSGGRAMEMANRGAGLASQDYQNYLKTGIDTTFKGVGAGQDALSTIAALLGQGAGLTSGVMDKENTLYNQFFDRLKAMAGLGATSPGASATAALDTGKSMSNTGLAGAYYQGSGDVAASNMLSKGITGAAGFLTNPASTTPSWLTNAMKTSFGGTSSWSPESAAASSGVNLSMNPGWYG